MTKPHQLKTGAKKGVGGGVIFIQGVGYLHQGLFNFITYFIYTSAKHTETTMYTNTRQ